MGLGPELASALALIGGALALVGVCWLIDWLFPRPIGRAAWREDDGGADGDGDR
jgi:hypothetical protein